MIRSTNPTAPKRKYFLLDLAGQVEVIEWGNKLMRVNMTIGLDNGNEGMLKSLVQIGRYNLRSNENDRGLVVNAPNLQRQITVRGNEIKENISYIIYKPENVGNVFLDFVSTDGYLSRQIGCVYNQTSVFV